MPTQFEKDALGIIEELASALRHTDPNAATTLSDAILDAPAVFTAGAGRSGLVLRGLAMRLMHLGIATFVAGDTLTRAIRPGELLLAASGSGETATSLLLAEKARKAGATVAVITATPSSRLAALADTVAVIGDGNLKGSEDLHPLGSLFEESLFLFLEALVLELKRRTGNSSRTMFANHANLE